MLLACTHEKSQQSFGLRAFACARDRSASDAEVAVGDHACRCNAAYNDEDHLGEAAVAAFRAGPMFRTDQVDGNSGFAYVGSLFHGRKYSAGFKAYAGAVLSGFPHIVVDATGGQAKKYPPERVNELFASQFDVPVVLVLMVRDSRCKMPRRSAYFCRLGLRQGVSAR